MNKTAAERGEELLSNPPARNEESLVEWIGNLRMARRDLDAELNDPRTRMGDRKVATIASVKSEVEQKLLSAEAVLDRVRNELPQTQYVEAEVDGSLNVQASVEKLAIASAASTIGQHNFQRFAVGINNFETELEPKLDPRGGDFPREIYAERLKQLIAMRDDQLAKLAAENFPTDEWIGKKPAPYGGEGDLGNIPTHFEKDETTKPAEGDVDGNWEQAFDKERKYRGIDQASKDADKVASVKKRVRRVKKAVSDLEGDSADERQEYEWVTEDLGGNMQHVVDNAEEAHDLGYDIGRGDFPNNHLGMLPNSSGAFSMDDFPDEKVYYAFLEGIKDGVIDSTPTSDMSDEEPDRDYEGTMDRRHSKKAAQPSNATPGSHEPASSGDGGAQMQAKPPEPEEAWETTMLDGTSSGAPRGPNRRTQRDVPAYSTDKSKLTSALKLASMYSNMTENQAWSIVNTVFASEEDDEEQVKKNVDEQATGSGEEASQHDVVNNRENDEDDLGGLFDE